VLTMSLKVYQSITFDGFWCRTLFLYPSIHDQKYTGQFCDDSKKSKNTADLTKDGLPLSYQPAVMVIVINLIWPLHSAIFLLLDFLITNQNET